MKITKLSEFLNKGRETRGITLYLHIGMPKTGSTAIQSFLSHNRNTLRREMSVLYPECSVPENQHTALVKSILIEKYHWTHFNELIGSFDPEVYINQLVRNCKENSYQKVILSSEYFWAAPSMQSGLEYHGFDSKNIGYMEEFVKDCRRLFEVFDNIKIIVYLRRQDYWIDSFFNQQLKDGFTIPSKEEILKPKNYLFYYENLRMWANHFGKENVIVRAYDSLKKQDIVLEFCNAVGINHRRLDNHIINKDTTNQRLSSNSMRIHAKGDRVKFGFSGNGAS